MAVVKKKKLKKKVKIILEIVLFLLIMLLIFMLIRFYTKNSIAKLNYSKIAVDNIVESRKTNYIKKVGYNKTLNAAFESKDIIFKNLNSYKKIKYVKQDNLIDNINKLLLKKYNEEEISLIISHGTSRDVKAFIKHKKSDDIKKYLIFPYAKLSLYDRYVAYQLKEREDEEVIVTKVNIGLDKEYYQDTIIIDDFSQTVLVNKYRQLSENFVPDNLMSIKKEYTNNSKQQLNKIAVLAFEELVTKANEEGYHIIANSSYRSYGEQEKIYQVYLKQYGEKYVKTMVALAGYSEHQTGLSLDVASKDTKTFINSKEYKWMMKNSYLYGFILRYPKGKENITGYDNEAWHYRYVGKDAAKYIYDNDITYDEYFVKFIDK